MYQVVFLNNDVEIVEKQKSLHRTYPASLMYVEGFREGIQKAQKLTSVDLSGLTVRIKYLGKNQ